MEETVFTGVREKWLPLYEELKRMTEAALGGFEVRAVSGALLWRHGSCFAELGAKKDCMTIAFASGAAHDEWQPVKLLQTSKNRVVHYFEVTGAEDFPAFVEKITAAYHLTRPAKPPAPKSGEAVQAVFRPEYHSIDEYIALFQPPVRDALQKVRETIRGAAPDAEEKISWQMPTFYQGGNLIHFAAAKAHLGVYPGAEAMEFFRDKLAAYKTSKGAIRIPWDKPIPYKLITDIVHFCVKQK